MGERDFRRADLGMLDTESGGHTSKPVSHTDDQIAAWLTRRLTRSQQWTLMGSVIFQLQDGPDPDHYGDAPDQLKSIFTSSATAPKR
jgi:hypothetical protein